MQYAAPALEYSPGPQLVQPLGELAPEPVYFPAGQFLHSRVDPDSYLYSPGPHESHLDAPALLKPVPHDVQESTEPVL